MWNAYSRQNTLTLSFHFCWRSPTGFEILRQWNTLFLFFSLAAGCHRTTPSPGCSILPSACCWQYVMCSYLVGAETWLIPRYQIFRFWSSWYGFRAAKIYKDHNQFTVKQPCLIFPGCALNPLLMTNNHWAKYSPQSDSVSISWAVMHLTL